MSYTLLDGRTFLRDNNLRDTTERGLRLEVRLCNHALALLRLGLGAKLEPDRTTTAIKFAAALQGPGTVAIQTDLLTLNGSVAATYGAEVVGRMIYIGSDLRPYRIAAYVLDTGVHKLTLAETYKGELLTLTAYSFTIADERQILPTDFKTLDDADQGSMLYTMEPLLEVAQMDVLRSRTRYFTVPKYYAVEFDTASSERRAYLRVWPAPQQAVILDLWYYGGPATLAGDADSFGLPNTPEAQVVIEEYLLAVLKKHQGAELAEYQVFIAGADALAMRYRGRLQPIAKDGEEREMYCGGGQPALPYRARFADGIVQTP